MRYVVTGAAGFIGTNLSIELSRLGNEVLLIDDVLATGGTLVAAIELVQQAGGIVTDIAVLSEISFLGGRLRIAEHSPSISIHALISG